MTTITRESKNSVSQQLQGFWSFLVLQIEKILSTVFAMTQAGGVARNLVFIWLPLCLWISIAIILHPLPIYILQGLAASIKEIVTFLNSASPRQAGRGVC